MPPLPHAHRAEVDIAKLRDYCLSPAHPRGRHKARLFKAALGIAQTDAEWLRQAILTGLASANAEAQETDEFGSRWQADVTIARQNRQVVVRTVWLLPPGASVPRLVTCWVV
jgi:hypothetical protein